MKQSQLFSKTRRHSPKDETAKNAELLIRAGFIHKEMAGVYSYLPLGLRVLNKIEGIIREEMNALGGQEISMTALQEKEIWEKTNRWDDSLLDNWFKTKLKNQTELGLATTHEEPLTRILLEYVNSYRDLPLYIYQFQTKFRNELRSKSGILRGREFLMKDLYSFSRDEKEHQDFYEKSKKSYFKIFERLGLGEKTFITFSSGGSFSKYSHEFQTLTEAGEDTIYLDEKTGIAINKEVYSDDVIENLKLEKSNLKELKAIEVGNIFSLGTKFSEGLGLNFKNEEGKDVPVIMGSYGIGLGRVMGAVVEVLSDEKGLLWPASIAPFEAHLIIVDSKDGEIRAEADSFYEKLSKKFEVLYDDRDLRAGEKFADAELIGIPYSLIISKKTESEGKIEVKERKSGKSVLVEKNKVLSEGFSKLF
ncbi:MAG: prolyl-tRNA synthetase [Candidatus Zambryskibacteria bacterium CG_4_9_14_3_um_filter_40_16]|uniref:Proline--tRNA ligase n=2 Tax=Candidatus Zambryskiibacteriota TaxID=1817925 RepID=A0A2M7WUZ0_9BACT|nr:MAG: prolyl-tRNA synthetase [Candidatus Zambryskibacteria bacterium CG_4_9_14_3_um_filter_40_16]